MPAEPVKNAIYLQGVVAFFPSFSYADTVYAHWQSSGTLAALSSRKHVFREPRSSVEVEAVLRQGSCLVNIYKDTRSLLLGALE